MGKCEIYPYKVRGLSYKNLTTRNENAKYGVYVYDVTEQKYPQFREFPSFQTYFL